MKALFAVLAFALLTAFEGCGSQPTTTPVIDRAQAQRTIFAAKEGYGVAVRMGTGYAQLARCKVPAVQPCSEQKVVDQITQARNVARDSLAAAQGAVDTPGFGDDIMQTAVTAAQASLSAFQSIATKYGSAK